MAALIAATMPATGNASVVVNIEQTGGDVVASYSGSIDLAGLTGGGVVTASSQIDASRGIIVMGTNDFYNIGSPVGSLYSGFSGPAAWGSGSSVDATSVAGDFFVFGATSAYLTPVVIVPVGYVSDAALSGGANFAGQTLGSLGLNVGQYVYTAGNQTITINARFGTSNVPEPASWALMIAGFGLVGTMLRARSRVSPRGIKSGANS